MLHFVRINFVIIVFLIITMFVSLYVELTVFNLVFYFVKCILSVALIIIYLFTYITYLTIVHVHFVTSVSSTTMRQCRNSSIIHISTRFHIHRTVQMENKSYEKCAKINNYVNEYQSVNELINRINNLSIK